MKLEGKDVEENIRQMDVQCDRLCKTVMSIHKKFRIRVRPLQLASSSYPGLYDALLGKTHKSMFSEERSLHVSLIPTLPTEERQYLKSLTIDFFQIWWAHRPKSRYGVDLQRSATHYRPGSLGWDYFRSRHVQ